MARRLTYEEVKNFIEVESGSGCKLLTKNYIRNSMKMNFKCRCGNIFSTTFAKFKNQNKRQCNECGRQIRINKKTKSNKEFVADVYKLVKEEYIFLEEYNGSANKIKCKHNVCGHIWHITPSNFLRGRRCPRCNRPNYNRDTKQFIKEVHKLVNGEYEVLGKYKGIDNHIKMKHNRCGNIWKVTPYNFLQGSRCPQCAIDKRTNKIRKTNKEFIEEVYNLVGDEYVFLEKYVNTETKIKCKHHKCGHEYYVKPANFLSGRRCPRCAESRGEQAIRKVLRNNNIDFKQEYSFDNLLGVGGQPLRFDFIIFGTKDTSMFLIEYDGEFHFKKQYQDDGFEAIQVHDQIKNQYCKDNNIPLLRIPYWEFDNIETILEEWLTEHGVIHNE